MFNHYNKEDKNQVNLLFIFYLGMKVHRNTNMNSLGSTKVD